MDIAAVEFDHDGEEEHRRCEQGFVRHHPDRPNDVGAEGVSARHLRQPEA
ncbi:MAG: hypothetical protein KDE35_05260 [Geminicoccaceae bacterium]|nr:hypothetical protein [Geminicoccaceae bacterium]